MTPWTDVDFAVNKEFWKYWGHQAAVPFRVANLEDLQAILEQAGLNSSLYGSTLRRQMNSPFLTPDHDDDVCLFAEPEALGSITDTISRTGFEFIRKSERLWSLERFERYIDLHFLPEFQMDTSYRRVNGVHLRVVDEPGELLTHLDSYTTRHDFRATNRPCQYLNRWVPGPRKMVRLTKSMIRSARSIERPKSRPRALALDEFLALKIDPIAAYNWSWRGDHWNMVFRPGENLGEALGRFRRTGAPVGQQQDMRQPFPEPLQLSRRFWKNGSDNLATHVRHGFRHNVLPYRAANLYILAGIKPVLYSDEYFDGLPALSDCELSHFLRDNPIEVESGIVTSGRHRAAAMLGHLLSGKTYQPFYVAGS